MSRLIIILFALLQQLAKSDRTCNKQKVCGNDHHNNREKEYKHRSCRIDDLHSQIICSGKDHRSRKCKEPVCLRRFFADILTSEHLNRTKFIYRHKHADHNKQKDRKKQTDCHKDRLHFYMNSESGRPVKKLNCQKFRKF